jgi:magnesium transporter
MTITNRLYCDGRLEEHDFDPERVSDELQKPGALVWLDVENPTVESIAMLGREFRFHELALEDCLHPHQRPKIEQYGSYYFMVAYGVTVEGEDLVPHEMAMFVGRNFLVTVRKPPALDLKGVLRRWDARTDLAEEGGGYLLYILLDEIVDGYFIAVDVYQDRIEELEEQVFGAEGNVETHERIFQFRKELSQFRRSAAPLRDVLDVMQRRTVDVVTPRLEPYFRDVYDHVLRATDFVDGVRDIMASALEANLTVVSNRLNEVMKELTAWAAIILLPTLVAGVYGMNFRHMPELNWLLGYPFALGLMLLSAGTLYVMFKRRDWL